MLGSAVAAARTRAYVVVTSIAARGINFEFTIALLGTNSVYPESVFAGASVITYEFFPLFFSVVWWDVAAR